ncbi:MAG: carboxymuconolactone decarboxylase family protein [Neisseriaceae bacterium]
MLDRILDNLPEYAKDIKLNFSSIVNNHNGLLSEVQFWGIILASSITNKNEELIAAVKAEKPEIFDEKLIFGANAAVSIMSMTNIYYRFLHLTENKAYSTMHAGLRMNVMRNPGVDSIDFEMMCLAVSIINGCGMCVDSHEKQLIKHGISLETIQLIAKIAAIINSLSLTMIVG